MIEPIPPFIAGRSSQGINVCVNCLVGMVLYLARCWSFPDLVTSPEQPMFSNLFAKFYSLQLIFSEDRRAKTFLDLKNLKRVSIQISLRLA